MASTGSARTGRQKAAVLMTSLPTEISSRVLRELSDEEVELLTLAIAELQFVSKEEAEQVAAEFTRLAQARGFVATGGISSARRLLAEAFGEEEAASVLNRLTASLQARPFDALRRSATEQVFSYLQEERPQVIALVLSYLEPDQAAQLLSRFPEEQRVDIVRRMAKMEAVSPDVVQQVEQMLERRMTAFTSSYAEPGGIPAVVQLLNNSETAIENDILDHLSETDPQLAEDIRKQLFVFEDIAHLSDRDVQRLLREVDHQDLVLALKGASEITRAKIFANMSQRAVEVTQEDLRYLGPTLLRDVQAAQGRIASLARMLHAQGEITIGGGGSNEILV
ncbi:MAG: flagellar motor switch protein FliG [Firmicutes bacterium]|nr:flagellar motor switch protein FliG [Bacillota bacterium]